MAFEKFIRTRVQSDEAVITIADNRFQYSAVFSKIAELNKYNAVEYFVDVNSREIRFSFSKENDSKNKFTLQNKPGSNIYRSAAKELISRYLWVKKTASMPKVDDRKFVAKKINGMWNIQLAPSFEMTFHKGDMPKEILDGSGIYRYLDKNNEIVYIGRGNIKNRYSESGREKWNFDKIEYSIINAGEQEQGEWESYWIEKFKESNNDRLPYYNKISGSIPKG